MSREFVGSGAPNRHQTHLDAKVPTLVAGPGERHSPRTSPSSLSLSLPLSLPLYLSLPLFSFTPLTLVPQTRAFLQPVVLCGSICCACARFQLRALWRMRMRMRGRRWLKGEERKLSAHIGWGGAPGQSQSQWLPVAPSGAVSLGE